MHHIVEVVIQRQGCKAIELAVALAKNEEIAKILPNFDLTLLVDELVASHSVVEVKYELPLLEYKTKSFLLPFGTKVHAKSKSR